MATKFSDFASCESLTSEAETEKNVKTGFQQQGRKKKRKKDKSSPSRTKESFMKKTNLSQSPNNTGNGGSQMPH